jgi:hypothetical protein
MKIIQIVAAALLASCPSAALTETPEQSFLGANGHVMDRMMSAMIAKATGDIDVDFVDLMEPHHQGAIEMAQLEIRYGHNEQLRRISQEIIVEQQQEIVAMRVALHRPLPPSATTPDQPPAPAKPMAGMSAPKPSL